MRTTLAAVLLLIGCDSWDPSHVAMQRAREVFSCETVELTQIEEYRWHAVGCSQQGDFACTGGALEPTCMQVRSAGGEVASDEADAPPPDTRSLAETEAALYAQAERDDPDLDPTADEGEAEAPPASTVPTETDAPSAAETAIRAGLDAHRADIYACTQHDPTVVRVDYTVDGDIEVHLAGGLAGTPEEGCVRAVLSGAQVPSGSSGTVLHLVHGG